MPEWTGEKEAYWELPQGWFNDFVERALVRYGKVYIIQPYREQEICARACQEALEDDTNAAFGKSSCAPQPSKFFQ